MKQKFPMQTNQVQPVNQTAEYLQLVPLIEVMRKYADQRPKNSLPIDIQGTVQQNAEKSANPSVTLYNAHGILTKTNQNSLLGYA